MIKYLGKYGQRIRQHMPSKPIRFGYKVWCLNLSGGYLYSFEVYQGSGSKNKIYSKEFLVGSSVVLSLLDTLPADGNFRLYCGNYFTSTELLEYCASQGIGVTGTIKANMVKNCPLMDKGEMKKTTERGFIDSYQEKERGLLMVRWHDNSQ